MSSNLTVKQGIYDPTRRFEFTNISDKDFTFAWGGTPIKIKAGEKVELPHHLAVLATGRLVDQIMSDEIKVEEDRMKVETRNPYFRSQKGGSLGVPAAREPYETKILKELAPRTDTDSAFQVIRAQKTEELMRDLKQENSPTITKMSDVGVGGVKEFEGVNLPKAH